MKIGVIRSITSNQKHYRRFEILLRNFMILCTLVMIAALLYMQIMGFYHTKTSIIFDEYFSFVNWLLITITYFTINQLMKNFHNHEYQQNKNALFYLWFSLQLLLMMNCVYCKMLDVMLLSKHPSFVANDYNFIIHSCEETPFQTMLGSLCWMVANSFNMPGLLIVYIILKVKKSQDLL